MKFGRKNAALIPVSGVPFVRGARIAVSSAICLSEQAGLLSNGRGRVTGVIACPADLDREPVVAAEEGFLERFDVAASDPWELTIGESYVRNADRITLAPATPRMQSDIRNDLSEHLGETVLWVPPNSDPRALTVTIAGEDYRVQSLDPWMPNALYRFGAETRVQHLSESTRVGVDVVILADASKSMATVDLFAMEDGPPRRISRLDAMKDALTELVDLRLRARGRASRVALLKFDTATTPCFPSVRGMVDFDGDATPEVARQFRDAILEIKPSGMTDIGKALIASHELLVRHGRPGNERLVVLLSDGANPPRRDERPGEIADDFKDPVRVMERMFRDQGIRLHAIGISTTSHYDRWVAEGGVPHETLRPNHELLNELVRVGGGDPSLSGGLEVLRSYFSDLSQGVLHDLPRLTHRPSPHLSDADRRSIREQLQRERARARPEFAELRQLADRLLALRHQCNEAAESRVHRRLFGLPPGVDPDSAAEALRRPAQDRPSFAPWIESAHALFFAERDGATARGAAPTYEVAAAQQALCEDTFYDLGLFWAAYVGTRDPDRGAASPAAGLLDARWRKYTGQGPPTDGPHPLWCPLQRALLREWAAVLERARDAINRATARPRAAEPVVEVVDIEKEKVDAYNRLCGMMPAQIEEVILMRLRLPRHQFSGSTAPQAKVAMEVVLHCENVHRLDDLTEAIGKTLRGEPVGIPTRNGSPSGIH